MGVKFDNIDSDTDLGLFFVHREISAPEAKRQTVEIPLRDGVIDLSRELSEVPRYSNRTIKMEFVSTASRDQWPGVIGRVYSALHGNTMDVILPEDSANYWHGFVTVTGWADEGASMKIGVEVDAEPFRRSVTQTSVGPITVSGETSQTVTLTAMRGYPTFTASTQMSVELDGEAYTISPLIRRAYGLEFITGDNDLIFDGSGTVTISYEEGSL